MKHLIFALSCLVLALTCMLMVVAFSGCAAVQQRPAASPYSVPAFTQQQLSQVTSYTIEALGGSLAGWQIMLTDTYIMQKGEGDEVYLADGITIPAKKMIVVFAYNECLADSALVHEIGHALGYDHGEFLIKLLRKVEEDAIKDLCPPGYVKGTPPDPNLMAPMIKKALNKGL